jgi:hypothetical protein
MLAQSSIGQVLSSLGAGLPFTIAATSDFLSRNSSITKSDGIVGIEPNGFVVIDLPENHPRPNRVLLLQALQGQIAFSSRHVSLVATYPVKLRDVFSWHFSGLARCPT